MNKVLPAAIVFTALLATARAQQPVASETRTAAEQQFRDAWWAETGQNDLETALRGYLAAAGAEGPAAVRAKALLQAGRVQQRLNKNEAALATFRKLVVEHATEREVVEQARAHLRELTAIDLRKNYDEWYDRRLFSEDVQLAILGKLEALAGKLALNPTKKEELQAHARDIEALKQEILAYGKGAEPALRKTVEGGSALMRSHALAMLVAMGELPPLPALLLDEGWMDDVQVWQLLLQQSPGQLTVAPGKAWHRPLLVAALQGPAELAAALTRSTDPHLESPSMVGAIAMALLHTGPGKKAILAALAAPSTPWKVRTSLENAVMADDEWMTTLSAAEWLAVTADPLRFQFRSVGIFRAAALLDQQDGPLLDEMLARIKATSGELRTEMVSQLAAGLERLLAPQRVPWSLSQLRSLITLAQSCQDQMLATLMLSLRRTPDGRRLLAEAVLSQPGLLHDAPIEEKQALQLQFHFDTGDERDNGQLASRWHEALAAVLARDWEKWTEPMRLDAVAMLGAVLHPSEQRAVEQRAVIAFLAKAKETASTPVLQAIESISGG